MFRRTIEEFRSLIEIRGEYMQDTWNIFDLTQIVLVWVMAVLRFAEVDPGVVSTINAVRATRGVQQQHAPLSLT